MPGGWFFTTTNHLENSRYCAKFPSTLFSKQPQLQKKKVYYVFQVVISCFACFFKWFLWITCWNSVSARSQKLPTAELLRAFESDIGKKILMKYGWTEGWQRANGFRRCVAEICVFFVTAKKKTYHLKTSWIFLSFLAPRTYHQISPQKKTCFPASN